MVVPSLMLAAGRARRLTPFANAQIDQRGARAAPSGGVPERQISSLAERPGMTQTGEQGEDHRVRARARKAREPMCFIASECRIFRGSRA